jgi:hypothetical protein
MKLWSISYCCSAISPQEIRLQREKCGDLDHPRRPCDSWHEKALQLYPLLHHDYRHVFEFWTNGMKGRSKKNMAPKLSRPAILTNWQFSLAKRGLHDDIMHQESLKVWRRFLEASMGNHASTPSLLLVYFCLDLPVPITITTANQEQQRDKIQKRVIRFWLSRRLVRLPLYKVIWLLFLACAAREEMHRVPSSDTVLLPPPPYRGDHHLNDSVQELRGI